MSRWNKNNRNNKLASNPRKFLSRRTSYPPLRSPSKILNILISQNSNSHKKFLIHRIKILRFNKMSRNKKKLYIRINHKKFILKGLNKLNSHKMFILKGLNKLRSHNHRKNIKVSKKLKSSNNLLSNNNQNHTLQYSKSKIYQSLRKTCNYHNLNNHSSLNLLYNKNEKENSLKTMLKTNLSKMTKNKNHNPLKNLNYNIYKSKNSHFTSNLLWITLQST